MNDDDIIRQRARGLSARAITKAPRTKAIDRWAATAIDDRTRKNTLALELARLDELQERFYARALEGDVQCGALVTKIIEHLRNPWPVHAADRGLTDRGPRAAEGTEHRPHRTGTRGNDPTSH